MVCVPARTRRRVEERAEHRREYCHAPQSAINARFHVEHFTPRSRGGTDDLDNLNYSCVTCNLAKGIAIDRLDPATGEHVPLFNLRTDQWHAHFEWAADGVTLIGKTPVGIATVSALKMNQPLQQNARPYWRRVGLFP